MTSNPELEIQVVNKPLPNTKYDQSMEKSWDGVLGSFIFSFGMALIPASIARYTV